MIGQFLDVGINLGMVPQCEGGARQIGPQAYVVIDEVDDVTFAHAALVGVRSKQRQTNAEPKWSFSAKYLR